MSEEMTMRRTPEVIAAEITTIRDQTRQVVLSAAIEIGKRLIEAKAMLPHGKWGGYIAQLEYSERTAQNLMRVFEEYGKKPNPQALADLSYTKAVALLALDEEQREELLEQKDVAEMSTRALDAEIDRIRKEAAERQVTIEALREELSGADRAKAEADEKARNAEENLKAAHEESRKNEDRLRKAMDEAESLKKKAEDTSKEVDRLKADLENAKKTETVIEQVEVIPAEVEDELERLRTIAAKAPSEEVIRFRQEYEHLVEQAKRIAEAFGKMSEADQEKYKPAVVKALDNMRGMICG